MASVRAYDDPLDFQRKEDNMKRLKDIGILVASILLWGVLFDRAFGLGVLDGMLGVGTCHVGRLHDPEDNLGRMLKKDLEEEIQAQKKMEVPTR